MTTDRMHRVLSFLLLLLIVFAGPVLYAQVATAATGAPVDPSANEWGGTMVWSFFSASIMEWLKNNQKIQFLTQDTAFWAKRVIGIVVAAAAALGVHYSYDASAGTLMITGLTSAGLWTMFTETARTWVSQELMYRVAVKPKTTGV